jgi:hypothetical protein
LTAAAVAISAVGLLVLTRGNPIGAVPLIAGIGALSGWLPFCWSTALSNWADSESVRTSRLASAGLHLIGMTTALVAAARLIPAAFAQNASVAEPVLFLAAAVTLVVASARLASWRKADDVILALTGMAACGIAADVVLRQGTSTLPVSIVRGDVAGMAVWLHGTAMWVLLNSFGRDSEAASLRGWRARTWLVALLAADIAGLPPLPGFWIRGNLLLSLVSRQTTSSITGEYEPHAGMLMLAILVTIEWGAIMTMAISAIADASTDDGTAAA